MSPARFYQKYIKNNMFTKIAVNLPDCGGYYCHFIFSHVLFLVSIGCSQ